MARCHKQILLTRQAHTFSQVDEADQQLEFLKEIQSAIGQSSELSLLSAMMASRKGQAAEAVLAQLELAATRFPQFRSCQFQVPLALSLLSQSMYAYMLSSKM